MSHSQYGNPENIKTIHYWHLTLHTLYIIAPFVWLHELWFSKRCIKFLKMALNSKNTVVKMNANMGINGMHFVMGRNLRLMESRFGMERYNVCKVPGGPTC